MAKRKEEVSHLAKLFHERYEYQANENNWNTQKDCKVNFEDLPEENKITMIKTVEDVLTLGNLGNLGSVKEVLEGIIEDEELYNQIEEELNQL